MGYISSLFERRSHPGNLADWLLNLGLKPTASGVNVTEQSSLESTAVFSCVRILAETEAMLPLIVYQRRQNRGKDRAMDHPLYPILHDLPNPEMTAMELRETLTGHLATWGNAYAGDRTPDRAHHIAVAELQREQRRNHEDTHP